MAAYPTALPTYESAGTYLDSNPHDALHDELYDEIVAVAGELGTSPRGSFASVGARVTDISKLWLNSTSTDGTAFTATVSQPGSLTLSQNTKTIHLHGKLVIYKFYFTNSLAGTVGNAVTINLPYAATSVDAIRGQGGIRQYTGNVRYQGMWVGASTTTISFIYDGQFARYSAALAVNSVCKGLVYYERA